MGITKKDINRTAKLIKIIEEFNLFDETKAGQKLKEEFFQPNGKGKVLKELFSCGEIQKYPELYRLFFRNTKVPKIFSNKERKFYPGIEGSQNTRKFGDMQIDWCKKKTEKKYANILSGILEYLPLEIRETIFCFYQMCKTLKEEDMCFDLYLEQVPHQTIDDKYNIYGYESKVFFIVWCSLEKRYGEEDVSYSLVGELKFDYRTFGYVERLCYGALYKDQVIYNSYGSDKKEKPSMKIFGSLRSTRLEINLEYLPLETKPSRLKNMTKTFEKCKKDFPEIAEVLRKRFRVKETSLEFLREVAECFNLVILPIEYSKFRHSSQYNEVVNRLGNCNVFVITTVNNYDPWGEVTDSQEEPKRKIFPSSLMQLELAIQFSVSSQRALYKVFKNLDERVDEIERAFNKNMRTLEAQLEQIQRNVGALSVEITALAIKMTGMEFAKIESNMKSFNALEDASYRVSGSTFNVNETLHNIEDQQEALIASNHISEAILRDIGGIIDSGGITMEHFELEFIKQKSKLEKFKEKVDKKEYMFVYTTSRDFYKKNSTGYVTF